MKKDFLIGRKKRTQPKVSMCITDYNEPFEIDIDEFTVTVERVLHVDIHNVTNLQLHALRPVLDKFHHRIKDEPSTQFNLTLIFDSTFNSQGLQELSKLLYTQLELWSQRNSIHAIVLDARKCKDSITDQALKNFIEIYTKRDDCHSVFPLCFTGFRISEGVFTSLSGKIKMGNAFYEIGFKECDLDESKLIDWFGELNSYQDELQEESYENTKFCYTKTFSNNNYLQYDYNAKDRVITYTLNEDGDEAITHFNDCIKNSSFLSNNSTETLLDNNVLFSRLILKNISFSHDAIKSLEENSAKLPDTIEFKGSKTSPETLKFLLSILLKNSHCEDLIFEDQDDFLRILLSHLGNNAPNHALKVTFERGSSTSRYLLDEFPVQLRALKLTKQLNIQFNHFLAHDSLTKIFSNIESYSQHLNLIFHTDNVDESIKGIITDNKFWENYPNASLEHKEDMIVLSKSQDEDKNRLSLSAETIVKFELLEKLANLFEEYPEAKISKSLVIKKLDLKILADLISLLSKLNQTKYLTLNIPFDKILYINEDNCKKFFAAIRKCNGNLCLDLTPCGSTAHHIDLLANLLAELEAVLRDQTRFTVIIPEDIDDLLGQKCQVLSNRNKLLTTYPDLADVIKNIFYRAFPEIYPEEKFQLLSLRLQCISYFFKNNIELKSFNMEGQPPLLPHELIELAASCDKLENQALNHLSETFSTKIRPQLQRSKFFSMSAPPKEDMADKAKANDLTDTLGLLSINL